MFVHANLHVVLLLFPLSSFFVMLTPMFVGTGIPQLVQRWIAEDSGFDIWAKRFSLHIIQTKQLSLLSNWYFPWGKAAGTGHAVDHSLLASAEVKNTWSCCFVPLYTLMVWHLITLRFAYTNCVAP